MAYWLMKSEPDELSIEALGRLGEARWDGVRNYQARNFLRAMSVGDEFFFYHSNVGLEIVGVGKISLAGIADPSDPEGKWAAVKVKPVRKLKRPITLKEIKADPELAEMELIKQSRLSVGVVRPEEWDDILGLSERRLG